MSLTAEPAAPRPTSGSPADVAVVLDAEALVVPAPHPAAGAVLPADPLPLPAGTWGADEALLALDEARLALPFAVPDAVVVSALTTVVLRCGDLAVKVYPAGTDPDHLARVTTALAGSATALLPVAEPVVTSWGVVSVQPWLTATGPVDWAGTGALLRAFHAEHADADVPAWQPLRRVLTVAPDLPDSAARVLVEARAALLAELAALRSPLGTGVVHGDVSPANVLATAAGPVLIDLDFAARAPLEYDLSSAARRADAGELDPATYLAFCRAYGADVRTWEGRAVLDAIAQLGGVAFRVWDDRRAGRPLDWLGATVARWRTPL
ncbi:phosphotransferase [Cellulomonas telluris]|uniref:phosphotransferase n=1 Tax=Cellulomonas telluris TaxID=2306636 RepID=UPI00145627DB|nr:phosphotransferase [Cellulomonas telluris]